MTDYSQPYPPQRPQPNYPDPSGYPASYNQPNQPQQETRKHAGLATAALVLGIIGFIFACIPFVNYAAYPIVLLAIVFGLIAIKWGKAKAGLVLGILGLAATILWSVAIAGAFNKASNDVNNYQACVNKASTTQQYNACDTKFNHDINN